jgi:putative hemolysin
MHTKKQCLHPITLLLFLCLLAGCASTTTPPTPTAVPPTPTAETSLANPASVFCEAQGGQTNIRTESGGEVGYCVFPDNGECEEWAFYRGECPAGGPMCPELADEMEQKLNVTVMVTDPAPFQDPISGQNLEGCQAATSGTGANFESVDAVIKVIDVMFLSRNWQADIKYDAGGPNGAFGGYRKDNAVCLWVVKWELSADAQCPADQPISACELAPEQKLYTIAVNCRQD